MSEFSTGSAKATPQRAYASVSFSGSWQYMPWRIKFLAILVLASGVTSILFMLLLVASFFLHSLASPLFWACLVTGDVGVFTTSSLILLNVNKLIIGKVQQTSARLV